MQSVVFIQDLALILAVAALVGWVCQRIGLSVVVGYLAAGILVGPLTLPVDLIADVASIGKVAQMGMVFLMFAIGMQLSIRRLRHMGIGLLFAVFLGAGLLYYLVRGLGAALGTGEVETLFFASMLMVSSSAIIGKALNEAGLMHERFARLAMGVTILEDMVAVMMLAVLSSLIRYSGGGEGGFGAMVQALGFFGAFVALAGVGCLLLVPWMLRKLSSGVSDELRTLAIGALLFLLALIAHRAGYSLALGAFLLGAVVAETPHRHQVERIFEGMRDIFTAVFFVAIGMQIDLSLLAGSWGLLVGLTAFVLIVRTFVVSTGLALVGVKSRSAIRAGLTATPIGEFSFIIAQMGVLAGAIDARYYPLVVGLSLSTSLLSPLLIRHSDRIAGTALFWQPHWLKVGIRFYQRWLEHMRVRRGANRLWQLSRKRFIQIGVEVLFITGLLIFSNPLLRLVEERFAHDWLFEGGPQVIFWTALALAVVFPLLAVWRNVSALAMLYSQVSTRGHPRRKRLQPLIELAIRTAAGGILFIWLSSFFPTVGLVRWFYLISVLVVAGVLVLLRRQLVYWHSELEVGLQEVLDQGENALSADRPKWVGGQDGWDIGMVECVLPDLAACQGQTLAELDLRARFGCSVAGIERQGYMITLPKPDTALFARDKVLLMGGPEQLAAGKRCLMAISSRADFSEADEMGVESILIPSWSRSAGRSLRDVAFTQCFGVQVAGIARGARRIFNPGAEEVLRAGDVLWTVGTVDGIRNLREWLEEKVEEGGDLQ